MVLSSSLILVTTSLMISSGVEAPAVTPMISFPLTGMPATCSAFSMK